MKYKVEYYDLEGGVGVKKNYTQEVLNRTLKHIVKILNESIIHDWFIAYGTLLGIIRDNNCIDNDDDVDIIIDKKNRNTLVEILKKNNFNIIHDCEKLVKTSDSEDYSTIDFYLAEINENGNFNDLWSEINWNNCYNFIYKFWNNVRLNIPNNAEEKLRNRYGDTWYIKQDIKVPYDKIDQI